MRVLLTDLLPFLGMVIVILSQVSTLVVNKAAMSQGIDKYVLIVYSDALSGLILLPCSLIVHRSERTPLTFWLLCKLFLLAVLGTSAQFLSYVGIQYSSPALGTAMLNLIPAFTFMLAIFFRLEKVDWRSKSSIAKSLGTVVAISGAFVATFYKGPTLLTTLSNIFDSSLPSLYSSQIRWMIGGLFLTALAFMDSAWYILQTFILKEFPAVLSVVFYLFFFNTILAAAVSLIVVKETSSWMLRADIGLVAILYTGTIGGPFRISITLWCVSKTGPVYVTMFKPLGIIFAIVMDSIFLGDSVSLGSLIGAIIIVSGFYAVMWGKAKEEKTSQGNYESSTSKLPLLQTKDETGI
ncbi:hypothetical protein K2173_008281 [Erythroxylum novogranatense]|uniref:WAT1-related protein n=1 Tax=Erythroxylum novogranatense TaxID=1862640 RepID=A0AAV8U3N0_9ROSI|nr:hypothetical protein K2173_008281 [Erythroxylum novogranatense]